MDKWIKVSCKSESLQDHRRWTWHCRLLDYQMRTFITFGLAKTLGSSDSSGSSMVVMRGMSGLRGLREIRVLRVLRGLEQCTRYGENRWLREALIFFGSPSFSWITPSSVTSSFPSSNFCFFYLCIN